MQTREERGLEWWSVALLAWVLISGAVIFSLQLHGLTSALICSCVASFFALVAICFQGVGDKDDAAGGLAIMGISAGVGIGLGMAHHGLAWPGAALGLGLFLVCFLIHEETQRPRNTI